MLYMMRFLHAYFTSPLDIRLIYGWYIRHVLFELPVGRLPEEMLHDLGQLHQSSEQKGEEMKRGKREKKRVTQQSWNEENEAMQKSWLLVNDGWSRFFP